MKSAHGRVPVSAKKGTGNRTRLGKAKKEERNSRIGVGGGGKRDKTFFCQYQIACLLCIY